MGQLSKTVEAAVHELKPKILGYEASQVEAIVHRPSRDIFADGGQIKMCALSAIEIACWDIVGKALGQPIYNLIGGRCCDNARASANGWYRCPRPAEDFASKAKEVAKPGYTGMRFDPFGVGREKDLLTWNPRLVNGDLDLPRSPGLGGDLNLDVVAEHPYSGTDMNIWEEDWHSRREKHG